MVGLLSGCIAKQIITHDYALAKQSVKFREYIFLTGIPKWIWALSSKYKSVEDLGPPEEARKNVMKQYLTGSMSTRLGLCCESNILSTSFKVADDGKLYYQIEVRAFHY
ncbi:PsbP domain-containing protein 1 chloroplastic [Bienertia sinuspersici]